ARTGYTGEDGFEVFVANADAAKVWDALLDAGREAGIKPIGLGARDTLRLEARFSLYGNDIDETTDPIEAGLGWTCKLDKEFTGRDVIAAKKAAGPRRKLAGLVIQGGVARHGHEVAHDGEVVGQVTSGTYGPTVEKNIALAYVPTPLSKIGTALAVRIRGKDVPATVVKTPFFRRPERAPFPTISSIRKSTSGCAPIATSRRSASRTSHKSSWGTSCSSSCRRRARPCASSRALASSSR